MEYDLMLIEVSRVQRAGIERLRKKISLEQSGDDLTTENFANSLNRSCGNDPADNRRLQDGT